MTIQSEVRPLPGTQVTVVAAGAADVGQTKVICEGPPEGRARFVGNATLFGAAPVSVLLRNKSTSPQIPPGGNLTLVLQLRLADGTVVQLQDGVVAGPENFSVVFLVSTMIALQPGEQLEVVVVSAVDVFDGADITVAYADFPSYKVGVSRVLVDADDTPFDIVPAPRGGSRNVTVDETELSSAIALANQDVAGGSTAELVAQIDDDGAVYEKLRLFVGAGSTDPTEGRLGFSLGQGQKMQVVRRAGSPNVYVLMTWLEVSDR